MTRRHADTVVDDAEVDALLSAVADSWDDPALVPADPAPVASALAVPDRPDGPALSEELEPQGHGGALRRVREVPDYDPDDPDAVPAKPLSNIGLLAELAAGRKTVEEVAAASGFTVDEIQKHLAVSLRQVPPAEIARALGLQAAQQQLTSGALYGTVLATLVQDMASGRMKTEHKIELAKLLARVGRVEPKEDKGVGAGSGFTLNIHMPAVSETPVVIEAVPAGTAEATS